MSKKRGNKSKQRRYKYSKNTAQIEMRKTITLKNAAEKQTEKKKIDKKELQRKTSNPIKHPIIHPLSSFYTVYPQILKIAPSASRAIELDGTG